MGELILVYYWCVERMLEAVYPCVRVYQDGYAPLLWLGSGYLYLGYAPLPWFYCKL